MERIYQWAWDRYGPRYFWAVCVIVFPLFLPVYLIPSLVVVALEQSNRYFEAAAVTAVAVAIQAYGVLLPGVGRTRLIQRWAAGYGVDRRTALEATYSRARGATVRQLVGTPVWGAVLLIVVGVIAGATLSRLVQYGIVGAGFAAAVQLIQAHNGIEAAFRPPRVALVGDTGMGDALPRSRPSFATWSNLSAIGTAAAFATSGALVAAVFEWGAKVPVLPMVIGLALTLVFGVPITVGTVVSPSLEPIRDLAEGTKRVAAGDYSQRLPVVQDDDFGVVAASFNRMQAGLAERQRLQAAFGTYVDPALATRLLEQGDDVFTGERREVTVMFIDIRDFTPYAEANTAEDTVARLNALFEIVVPAVVDTGGHVNKFLGDGALAVFGAPNDLADHADAAVSAAVSIHRLVGERFGGELRIGIGINTGVVIAGTIGGAGKLEFTLIGDTVNVAARVEQLTKTTGDAILLTGHTVDALDSRPPELVDRGNHALKGKSSAVQVFGLAPRTSAGK
jgi:adenylate cyclase